MINNQYALTIQDIEKFEELKNSILYRDYVLDIINSPVFKMIIKNHVEDIDITNDIEELNNKGKSISSTELNNIFKKSISKMSVGIVADTIIMKEITDLNIQDVKDELQDNFNIKYLLGLAEKSYYTKAEEMLNKNPDTSSVLYKGLVEYLRKNKLKTTLSTINDELNEQVPTNKKTKKQEKDSKKVYNIDASDIRI